MERKVCFFSHKKTLINKKDGLRFFEKIKRSKTANKKYILRRQFSKNEEDFMRGYQKRVIYIKNTGSEIFEEAYFILKDSDCEPPTCDIVREAERLLSESEAGVKHRFSFGWDEILFFLAGILMTALFFMPSTSFSDLISFLEGTMCPILSYRMIFSSNAKWQLLYFFPLPHQHGAFRSSLLNI